MPHPQIIITSLPSRIVMKAALNESICLLHDDSNKPQRRDYPLKASKIRHETFLRAGIKSGSNVESLTRKQSKSASCKLYSLFTGNSDLYIFHVIKFLTYRYTRRKLGAWSLMSRKRQPPFPSFFLSPSENKRRKRN